jgi:DNA-binding NtrC family response regulator
MLDDERTTEQKRELQPCDGSPPVPAAIVVEVIGGTNPGIRRMLTYGRYRIGKRETCDVVVEDSQVSREHLELVVTRECVQVRDLGSKNGSFCKGVKFNDLMIGLGAVIVIGGTTLRIRANHSPEEGRHFGELVGRSPLMRKAFEKLERIASSESSLLIDGETGTGKEVCAVALHAASARAGKPFVVCDLAALPRTLVESELFGHVRGSFTGAERDRDGAFARANGGTILLDEIGELPLEAQPVLLRAIENRTVKPIGSQRYVPVDVRVIATTHRDLEHEVQHGRFRADLYYRLSVFRVTLPPLRERREDIPLLAASMLAASKLTLSDRALVALCNHDWPGNIRELRNAVERMLSLTGEGEDLDPALIGIGLARGSRDHEGFREARAVWERDYIARLIERADGNVSRAARDAGLGRTHMYQLMKKYGI